MAPTSAAADDDADSNSNGSNNKNKNTTLIIALVVPLSVLLIAAVLFALWWKNKLPCMKRGDLSRPLLGAETVDK